MSSETQSVNCSTRTRCRGAALPMRYRNRPAPIRQAIYRAWEIAHDMNLQPSVINVLQAVIALGLSVDNPYEPIFAAKKTIAKAAGVGEATVYRTLAVLVERGWLSRGEQPRRDDGSLGLSQLHATKALLVALNLEPQESAGDADQDDVEAATPAEATTDAPTKQAPQTMQKPTGQPQLIDGLIDGAYRGNDRFTEKASVGTPVRESRFVAREGRMIPAELVHVVDEKLLSIPQLLSLMKLARAIAGQDLAPYIALREDRLKALESANSRYKYLKKLIKEKVDARAMLAYRQRKEHRQERQSQRQAANEQRVRWMRIHDGKLFHRPGTDTTYQVCAAGMVLVVGKNGVPQRELPNLKVTGAFIRSVESGALQAYRSPRSGESKKATLAAFQSMLRASRHGH